jgi:glycosyltransferase involved in cell wall biosynthesis
MVSECPILRQSVSFTGWVDDVAPFLREADVYAFPSRTEGMSNALLEACALRRVVVASDIPANRAVLGEGYPLLFRAGSGVDLGSALERALDDGRARSDAVAHIDRRLPLFSVNSVLDRLEALLRAADRPRH